MTDRRPWSDMSQRRAKLLAVGIVVAGAVVLGLMIRVTSRDEQGAQGIPASTVSTVRYEVEGSVKWADVTMQTPTGTSQITPDVPMVQAANGTPGLTFKFPAGSFVYIAAQKKGAGGIITCRITVDGYVVAENSSSAAYGIATCKGSA